MTIASVDFFAAAALLLALYHLVLHPRWREVVLACGNVIFLGAFLPHPAQRALLAGVVLSGYAMVWAVQRAYVRSRALAVLYGAALVGVFTVVRLDQMRLATGVAEDMPVLPLIGLSYVIFRILHMLVDACSGVLPPVAPLSYLNCTCAFYAFVAGPIQRYGDHFEQGRAQDDRVRVDVLGGLGRMVDGCLKVFAFAPLVEPYTHTARLVDLSREGSLVTPFLVWFYAYYVFLFLDFSGYTDIMTGLAALLGLRLPENFNRPWLARNLIDFWQRWHITLSLWLRDYVFHPTHLALTRAAGWLRWPNMAFAYLVTFAVAGIWHGPSVSFLLFGLLHGLGLVINQIGADLFLRLSPATRGRYRDSRLVRVLAVVICQTYVAFTTLIFAHPLGELAQVWSLLRGMDP